MGTEFIFKSQQLQSTATQQNAPWRPVCGRGKGTTSLLTPDFSNKRGGSLHEFSSLTRGKMPSVLLVFHGPLFRVTGQQRCQWYQPSTASKRALCISPAYKRGSLVYSFKRFAICLACWLLVEAFKPLAVAGGIQFHGRGSNRGRFSGSTESQPLKPGKSQKYILTLGLPNLTSVR